MADDMGLCRLEDVVAEKMASGGKTETYVLPYGLDRATGVAGTVRPS